MLTGVSHDLRTILTRFKLQLAIVGNNPDLESLNQDGRTCRTCWKAISPSPEETRKRMSATELSDLMARLSAEAELYGKTLTTAIQGENEIHVRPNAFTRSSPISHPTAYRYANTVHIEARQSAKWLTIQSMTTVRAFPSGHAKTCQTVLPPGRSPQSRQFRHGPRLAVARDIARSHGGNVTLADSPLGGLRDGACADVNSGTFTSASCRSAPACRWMRARSHRPRLRSRA